MPTFFRSFIDLCSASCDLLSCILEHLKLSEAHLSLDRRDLPMNIVRRLIVILFLLSGMAALTYSQAPVKLNGSEGMALLNSLTKGPLNTNNTSLNNTSLNATNSSTKLTTARGSSGDDFWSWGTRPKDLPLERAQSADDYLNDTV
jgi:hypothetical protein